MSCEKTLSFSSSFLSKWHSAVGVSTQTCASVLEKPFSLSAFWLGGEGKAIVGSSGPNEYDMMRFENVYDDVTVIFSHYLRP